MSTNRIITLIETEHFYLDYLFTILKKKEKKKKKKRIFNFLIT
jgi:hypothetical protein